MARIQTNQGKKRTTYTATIRVKGYPTLARTFDTKGEAKNWAADVEREMRMGRYQDVRAAENLTLTELLHKYLEQISTTKRPNSERRDRDSVKAIIAGLDKDILLTKVTTRSLAEYRDARIKVVSPSTIQKEFALLSHLFNTARREWGLPVDNPVKDVSRPKIANNRTRFLTNKEAQKLLETAKGSRNRKLHPYLVLMMHTGMRPSEAAGLKWGDVDLEARLVKLHITKTEMRYVPLTERASEVLNSIKPDEEDKEGYIFLTPKSMKSKRVRNVPSIHFKSSFETVRDKAGMKDVHLHDLRHTAASHLLMAGVDIRTLAEILGHKTMQMVQRYTHLLNDHKLKAVDRINSLGID